MKGDQIDREGWSVPLKYTLPAMNQDQGPLMHMEVTKDKDAWTNKVVREFYRKNSVVEIDREAGGKNE